MRINILKVSFFVVLLSVVLSFDINTVYGNTNPHSVETSVRNAWNNGTVVSGSKDMSWTSGRRMVYDVYSSKYLSNGWTIETKTFSGQSSQRYLKFDGWAVLSGYKRHTTNHSTHIVLVKNSGKSGVGDTKIYNTVTRNIHATEDLEYNNQGPNHIYNECSSTATNRNNLDCNMRYENVGFTAYIPIDEIFPDPGESASWVLYIVKRVDSQIVRESLRLPFNFNNLSLNGGDLSLSSGINANKLKMNDEPVLKRTYARQPATEVSTYFTKNNIYTRNNVNEAQTAVWYGVSSDGGTRWANTTYWTFTGDQAVLRYTKENAPPVHISHALLDARYTNGNDYWVQPNDQVYVRLRQRDPDSGNKFQYIKLEGNGAEARSLHAFYNGTTYNEQFNTDSNLVINNASREENTSYGRVKWGVIPKTHGHSYDISYYYADNAENTVGYVSTGMKLRVDGVSPTNSQETISGHGYQDGLNYWIQPGNVVNIHLRGNDSDSGLRSIGLSTGSGSDRNIAYHYLSNSSSVFSMNSTATSGFTVVSANRDYISGSVKGVTFKVRGDTHGESHEIRRRYEDNVNNKSSGTHYDTHGWSATNKKQLRVDGEAPAHDSQDISDYRYKDGNDYWVRPNDSLKVQLKQYDPHSGNNQQYFRLYGSGVDVRSLHSFSGNANYNELTWTDSNVVINTAERIENGDYGTVNWTFTPKTHGHAYDVRYYYRDNVINNSGYISTGYKVRVDGEAPTRVDQEITDYRYKDGNNLWVQPNDVVTFRLRGNDPDSKLSRSNLTLLGSLDRARVRHHYGQGTSSYDYYEQSSHVDVISGGETYKSTDNTTRESTFKVSPKTHGRSYSIYLAHYDNVDNNFGWYDTDFDLKVDGVAPYTISETITNHRYKNGDKYWIRPGDVVDIHVRVNDVDSGVKNIALSTGEGTNRNVVHHYIANGVNDLDVRNTSPDFDVQSANRSYSSGSTHGVTFKVKGNAHGVAHKIRHKSDDNVNNYSDGDSWGWTTSNLKELLVDGVAPTIQFRNIGDTSNFHTRDWGTTAIGVKLKFNDGDSGYKRSRYSWTQSTSLPSTWSSWSTNTNYNVTKSDYGAWYLHVQAEDNVGNVRTSYQGPYRFNNAPDAAFQTDQTEYYVGDTMTVTSLASDPDGNDLTYNYTITLPNGTTTTRTTPNFTYKFPDIPGVYTIRQDVTDIHGEGDWVATTIPVHNLSIVGRVEHTANWEARHNIIGNLPSQFYSGEIFVLKADVIDHPINRVEVDFSGYQNNGNLYTRKLSLSRDSGVLYSGMLDDPQFAEGGTRLANGNATFVFTAYYSNGIVRTDTKTVEIIGSVYDALRFHKLH